MAVSLHALASLVLVDLGLPLFLKGSHIKNFLVDPAPQTDLTLSGARLSVIRSLYSRGIR